MGSRYARPGDLSGGNRTTKLGGRDHRMSVHSTAMTDQEILAHIHTLMDEEHELSQANVGGGASPEVAGSLSRLEVEIDRHWDLLRQRRALRRVGRDPEAAEIRPPGEVEGYEQ